MRILLVEDQLDKREKIKEFLNSNAPNSNVITDKESLRGALKELISNQSFDLILLDMSMPNFDPSINSPKDSSPESFAGKELIEQLKLRNITIPVIVITQYSSFEGGTVTLEILSNEISNTYGEHYYGLVYFNSATDTWKSQLKQMLEVINAK
jgi:CheY-like chemotaxis protein